MLSSQPAQVLVVCTANVCRSPAVAAVLRAALGPGIRVQSAGVQARPGMPPCEEAGAWLQSVGAQDQPGEGARRLEVDDVRSSALILGATRSHRSAAVALAPAARRRAFTLPQIARMAGGLGTAALQAPAGLDAAGRLGWVVDELDAHRGLVPLPDSPEDDDLPDPHGEARHEDVLRRLHRDVERLVAVLT